MALIIRSPVILSFFPSAIAPTREIFFPSARNDKNDQINALLCSQFQTKKLFRAQSGED
jgi:hypothetical protein